MVLVDPKITRLLPAVETENLRALVRKKRAVAGINGGFFNHADGRMASFVRSRGEWLGDPRKNRRLMENPQLKRWLPQILDRSELRIYPDGCRILPHSAPEDGATALLQAGPRLLPSLRLEEEAFYFARRGTIVRDPLRARASLARAAVGIRPDGQVVLTTFDGVSLRGLARGMKILGCQEALALDGGSSTALVAGKKAFGAETVRSALLVLP